MQTSKIKPILGLALLVLSVIFFLVSLGGLVSIWVYNQPLTERALTLIETTSQDLEGAALAIELSRTELISAQAQLDLLQAILETLGINAEEDLNRLADIVGRVEDTLSPVLDRVSGGIGALRESLLTIRDTLERINELPLVNIEIPGIEGIEQGAEQLQNLQNQIEEGGGKIEQLAQTTQDTVELALHRVCPAGDHYQQPAGNAGRVCRENRGHPGSAPLTWRTIYRSGSITRQQY